jgi:hypothetical protein
VYVCWIWASHSSCGMWRRMVQWKWGDIAAIFSIEQQVCLPHAGFLLRSLFHSEDWGYLFFETSIDSPDYGSLYPRRENCLVCRYLYDRQNVRMAAILLFNSLEKVHLNERCMFSWRSVAVNLISIINSEPLPHHNLARLPFCYYRLYKIKKHDVGVISIDL